MAKPATAVYALTQQGVMTAEAIAAHMPTDLYVPPSLGTIKGAKTFDSLRALVAGTFSAYRRHIFITAAGVAVRCIAPHLKDKSIDPAVVVLDHHGKNVISLLSGHLGGANSLAHEVADVLGGQAVITTATDTENLPSLDVLAMEFNMAIVNISAVAAVNGALLAGKSVIVDDAQNLLQLKTSAWRDLFTFTRTAAYNALSEDDKARLPRVTVTPAYTDISDTHLVLRPKVLHIGIGCRRGAKSKDILALIDETLEKLELAPASIACLASAEVKQHEPGLIEAAAALKAPLKFFSVAELDTVPVTAPSPKAREVFGIDGVCEAAAMLAAGDNGKLLLPKKTARSVTIAVAQEIIIND